MIVILISSLSCLFSVVKTSRALYIFAPYLTLNALVLSFTMTIYQLECLKLHVKEYKTKNGENGTIVIQYKVSSQMSSRVDYLSCSTMGTPGVV